VVRCGEVGAAFVGAVGLHAPGMGRGTYARAVRPNTEWRGVVVPRNVMVIVGRWWWCGRRQVLSLNRFEGWATPAHFLFQSRTGIAGGGRAGWVSVPGDGSAECVGQLKRGEKGARNPRERVIAEIQCCYAGVFCGAHVAHRHASCCMMTRNERHFGASVRCATRPMPRCGTTRRGDKRVREICCYVYSAPCRWLTAWYGRRSAVAGGVATHATASPRHTAVRDARLCRC